MTQLPILLIFCVSWVYSAKYSVNLERLEQCEPAKDNPYVEFPHLKLKYKHDKAVGIKNGDVKLLETINKDVNVKVKIYKKIFYYWVPVFSISRNVCKFIKSDELFYPVFLELVDLPKTCPLKQGGYKLKQTSSVLKSMPPIVPNGCVRLDFILSGKAGHGCIRAYVTLSTPGSDTVHVCKV